MAMRYVTQCLVGAVLMAVAAVAQAGDKSRRIVTGVYVTPTGQYHGGHRASPPSSYVRPGHGWHGHDRSWQRPSHTYGHTWNSRGSRWAPARPAWGHYSHGGYRHGYRDGYRDSHGHSYGVTVVPRYRDHAYRHDWRSRYYYDRHGDRFYDRVTRIWLTPHGFELRVGSVARGWRNDSYWYRQHYRDYDRDYDDRYRDDGYYDNRYYDDGEYCDD